MDKIESLFSGKYITILVKYVCREPFLVAEYEVFFLRRDVLLHYVEM
jgi:hypothetical protein